MKPGKSHLLDLDGVAAHPSLPADTSAGTWCLPSGRALAEFALNGGFAAPRVWLGLTPNQRTPIVSHPSASGDTDAYTPHHRRRDSRDFPSSHAVEER